MIALSFITDNGSATAKELAGLLPDSEIVDLRGQGKLRSWVSENFHNYEGHVFIMSLGIVYRVISDLITDKYHDPAVVVIDDARRYAIAALSGHEGGANALCWQVAGLLGCEPVVTTASDTSKRITLGVGCRKGTSATKIETALLEALASRNLEPTDVRLAASIDIKRDETGLREAFINLGIPLVFVDSDRIRSFSGSESVSGAAMRQLGVPGVSEPCALLIGRHTRLLMPRTVIGPVTVALAREDEEE